MWVILSPAVDGVQDKKQQMSGDIIEILLADYDLDDVQQVELIFRDFKLINRLNVTNDAGSTLAYLQRQGEYHTATTPDLIFLNMDSQQRSNYKLLAELQTSSFLRDVPVIAVTSTQATLDILNEVGLMVNTYILKPLTIDSLVSVLQGIDNFWLSIVRDDFAGADS